MKNNKKLDKKTNYTKSSPEYELPFRPTEELIFSGRKRNKMLEHLEDWEKLMEERKNFYR